MKLITWNVNGIRAVAKKGFADFLLQQNPDILCLQESKAHREQCDPTLQMPTGYVSHWSSAKKAGYSGTVSYFRASTVMPKLVSHGIDIEEFDSEGRFVVSDHEEFLLYNVYFPNGGSGQVRHDFKQKFLRQFTTHLSDKIKQGREIILVGDYNVAHTDIDVHNPARLAKESGFLPEERAWFSEFLQIGFTDMFRQFHPDEAHKYTWWSQIERARMGNRGWRIDYICATAKLARRFVSCDHLDEQMGSDHCPVVAVLK